MRKYNPNIGEQPGYVSAALFGRCPNCGARSLFKGPVKFAQRCRTCGLDFSQFNVGDGPAAFLTLIVGGLIVGLALWLEVALHPPFWLHALLWIPITAGAVVWGLRAAKTVLIAAEFRRDAGEGRRRD